MRARRTRVTLKTISARAAGGAPLVKKALQRVGVPTLIIDGDCVDDREYQEGQVSTRLEAFLESLKQGEGLSS